MLLPLLPLLLSLLLASTTAATTTTPSPTPLHLSNLFVDRSSRHGISLTGERLHTYADGTTLLHLYAAFRVPLPKLHPAVVLPLNAITHPKTTPQHFLLRANTTSGAISWARLTLSFSSTPSLAFDNNGNAYLFGPSDATPDEWLMEKVSPHGSLRWTRSYPTVDEKNIHFASFFSDRITFSWPNTIAATARRNPNSLSDKHDNYLVLFNASDGTMRSKVRLLPFKFDTRHAVIVDLTAITNYICALSESTVDDPPHPQLFIHCLRHQKWSRLRSMELPEGENIMRGPHARLSMHSPGKGKNPVATVVYKRVFGNEFPFDFLREEIVVARVDAKRLRPAYLSDADWKTLIIRLPTPERDPTFASNRFITSVAHVPSGPTPSTVAFIRSYESYAPSIVQATSDFRYPAGTLSATLERAPEDATWDEVPYVLQVGGDGRVVAVRVTAKDCPGAREPLSWTTQSVGMGVLPAGGVYVTMDERTVNLFANSGPWKGYNSFTCEKRLALDTE